MLILAYRCHWTTLGVSSLIPPHFEGRVVMFLLLCSSCKLSALICCTLSGLKVTLWKMLRGNRWANKVARQEKSLAAPCWPEASTASHIMEGRTDSWKLSSDLTCMLCYMLTDINRCNFKKVSQKIGKNTKCESHQRLVSRMQENLTTQ